MTRAPAPAVVLVEPQMGENIGAAARVMANFGLTDLRLVAPRDGWPNPKAVAMSAGALDDVVAVRVFDDVSAALADLHLVFAATARRRDMEKDVFGARESVARLRAADLACGVMFGAEASGLSNDDVVRADAILSFPVSSAFSSLNLAQAVAALAYEWAAEESSAPPQTSVAPREAPAPKSDLDALVTHLVAELKRAQFFHPPHKTELMSQNLYAAFARGGLTEQEVRTLRGAIKALADGPRRTGEGA